VWFGKNGCHNAACVTRPQCAQGLVSLAAESAVTVFTLAFSQWLADGESRSLSLIIAETPAELRTLNVPR
jgi:hypothetical protein